MKEISQMPNLVLVEPGATIDFAERYAVVAKELNVGINDALLLQIMIDSEIVKLFSYDKQFVKRAKKLNIQQIF